MKLLREAGDFPNKCYVEYATIRIDMPYKLIPSIIREENSTCGDDDIVKGLYVTPTGRITWRTLYLNSNELAENFLEHLHTIFKKRNYANNYTLRIEINSTSETITATKGKIKHSTLVEETLKNYTLKTTKKRKPTKN